MVYALRQPGHVIIVGAVHIDPSDTLSNPREFAAIGHGIGRDRDDDMTLPRNREKQRNRTRRKVRVQQDRCARLDLVAGEKPGGIIGLLKQLPVRENLVVPYEGIVFGVPIKALEQLAKRHHGPPR